MHIRLSLHLVADGEPRAVHRSQAVAGTFHQLAGQLVQPFGVGALQLRPEGRNT